MIQPIFDARVAEVGDPLYGRPRRRLTQRQTARPARQRYPQQRRPVDHLALALDRLGLQRQAIKIQTGRKPGQHLRKSVAQNRCCTLHLPLESRRSASRQSLF
jgi:hypothetical protein